MPNTALPLEKEEAVWGLANSLFLLKFDFILLFFCPITDQQDSGSFHSVGLVQRPETRSLHIGQTCGWLPDRGRWSCWLPDNGLWQCEHHVQRAPACGPSGEW